MWMYYIKLITNYDQDHNFKEVLDIYVEEIVQGINGSPVFCRRNKEEPEKTFEGELMPSDEKLDDPFWRTQRSSSLLELKSQEEVM